jgi:hypothetical protein
MEANMNMAPIFLLGCTILAMGCSYAPDRQIETNVRPTRSDVSNRFIPTISFSDRDIVVQGQNNSNIFSYQLDRLLDIDENKSEQRVDFVRARNVLKAAISGAFEAGYYETYKEELKKAQNQAIIQKILIGYPLLISALNNDSDNFYFIPILYNERMVACAFVREDATNKVLRLASVRYINNIDQTIMSIPRISQSPLSINTASLIARNSFGIQSLERKPRRVRVRNNTFTGYYFLWEIFTSSGERRFISMDGDIYRPNNSMKTLSIYDDLPSNFTINLQKL